MSCTEFDLRDYFLGELPEADRLRAARHVAGCSGCSEELGSLHQLRLALESLPDQEPPQRIGFVSDKIFEPSRMRRLWNSFWHSAPRLGFASAGMLSAALVFFALRPSPVVRIVEKPVPAVTASALTPPDLQPLIQEAVRKAVAETEARQQSRTATLLSAVERKHEEEHRALMLQVADSFTMLQKRAMVSRASLVNYGGGSEGNAQ